MPKPSVRLPWRAILGITMALSVAGCTRPATTRPLPASENAGQASTPGTTGATATNLPSFPAAQQTSVAQTATARARGGSVTPLPTVAFTPRPVATATAPPPTLSEPTAAPTSTAGGQTYTVQEGDTLFSIAVSFGLTVEQLAQANNIADPSSIFAGQVLVIPSAGEIATAAPAPTISGQRTYVVQEGDNCFRIALNYGLTCEQLAAANGLTPPDYLVYPGQVLVIP